jgi:hypothetical protein
LNDRSINEFVRLQTAMPASDAYKIAPRRLDAQLLHLAAGNVSIAAMNGHRAIYIAGAWMTAL